VGRPVQLVKGAVSTAWLRRIVDILARWFTQTTVLELEGDHACHIQSMDAFLDALDKHLASAGRA
jgi:hypothetical protein